jgi:DNA-binding CsgD family transcriptional regulator
VGLRLSARLAAPRERPALLRQAADMLHACADHYGTALALTDLTAALAGLGETRRARIIGARAARAAGRCGAEPLLAVLAQYLDVAQYYDVDEYCDADETDPGASPGEDDLSRAERRVADLAVQGLSNREISQRLFITVSTVEQHLTKVYRKFGVSRRTDLAVARSAAQPSSSYP